MNLLAIQYQSEPGVFVHLRFIATNYAFRCIRDTAFCRNEHTGDYSYSHHHRNQTKRHNKNMFMKIYCIWYNSLAVCCHLHETLQWLLMMSHPTATSSTYCLRHHPTHWHRLDAPTLACYPISHPPENRMIRFSSKLECRLSFGKKHFTSLMLHDITPRITNKNEQNINILIRSKANIGFRLKTTRKSTIK